jgi:hypothetical protein
VSEAWIERRLAAIPAADVIGYSRQPGVDEEGTLLALKLYRHGPTDPTIGDYRGRIVKNDSGWLTSRVLKRCGCGTLRLEPLNRK